MKALHSILRPYYIAIVRDQSDDYWQFVISPRGPVVAERINAAEDVKQQTRVEINHIRGAVLGWDSDVWPEHLKQGTLEFLCVAPHSFVVNEALNIERQRSGFELKRGQ